MKASRSKFTKTFQALEHCLRSPGLARKTLADLYNARIVSLGEVPSMRAAELIGTVPEVRLVNFVPEHGNVTAFELLCLCMMIKAFAPKQVLELGTFNGNTTLQIAANLSTGATITTLDLPLGADAVAGNDEHDAKLIHSAVREKPRYVASPYEDRVRQVYANSLESDFATLTPIAPDFIFIDAGHSDECVRNDTEKSLKVLADGGCIVWHDYTQDWPDVFNYLNELATELPINHIHGTNLVVYRKNRS
ncbi:MAG: class I SAM-dependent methyltransferase [Gammaproteobacteria bacterium]